ncbi:SRPBCC family protein [Leptospira stimsonii]|uniref:Polyketide cyclase n=1 Tax=Leptospira stimsonii TaxID=2202203 RepID=A0A4R9L7Z2_9LEPT|nr:SRPBCC domain-containing protein [Leptospira stimsonii]RHX83843.1 polyketide cyclase [Leptospira stimsonii]TGK18416.1 SRPBCC domain-containing protein [Leptospira stimsonii]TGM21944.1 SRPBCC domain-containing protein [Leptospira stimsonii]
MSERKDIQNPEFTFTRTFDFPRELVWKAWTEPKRLAEWWGPKGLKMGVTHLDLKPGGLFHYSMTTPDGQTMWGRFVYKEITPPEKLVYVVSFSDENAGMSRPPMAANWPLEILNTVIFTEEKGKTILSLKGTPINATPEEIKVFGDNFPSMNQGFTGTLDQLEAYLAKQ